MPRVAEGECDLAVRSSSTAPTRTRSAFLGQRSLPNPLVGVRPPRSSRSGRAPAVRRGAVDDNTSRPPIYSIASPTQGRTNLILRSRRPTPRRHERSFHSVHAGAGGTVRHIGQRVHSLPSRGPDSRCDRSRRCLRPLTPGLRLVAGHRLRVDRTRLLCEPPSLVLRLGCATPLGDAGLLHIAFRGPPPTVPVRLTPPFSRAHYSPRPKNSPPRLYSTDLAATEPSRTPVRHRAALEPRPRAPYPEGNELPRRHA